MDLFWQYWGNTLPEEGGEAKRKVIFTAIILIIIAFFIVIMIIFHPALVFNSSVNTVNSTAVITAGVRNIGSYKDSEANFILTTEPQLACTVLPTNNCVSMPGYPYRAVCNQFTQQDSVNFVCDAGSSNTTTLTFLINSRYQTGFHQFICTRTLCKDVTPDIRGSFPVLQNYAFLYPFEILGIIK